MFRFILPALFLLSACSGPEPETKSSPSNELLRVDSITVTQQDLDLRIQQAYDGNPDKQTRQAALDDLIEQSKFAQAALDAGLADDPVIRQEMNRLLKSRLRETELNPRIEAVKTIPQSSLKEIYDSQIENFQSAEERQVAVLWLNPGSDPERQKRYSEKMQSALAFATASEDIQQHPEKGFSVLSVDHSEHRATKFRGGVLSWLKADSGSDPWSRAVTEIAFGLKSNGQISEPISNEHGIFLVRLIKTRPSVQRSFESVASELEKAERARIYQQLEADFEADISSSHDVVWAK